MRQLTAVSILLVLAIGCEKSTTPDEEYGLLFSADFDGDSAAVLQPWVVPGTTIPSYLTLHDSTWSGGGTKCLSLWSDSGSSTAASAVIQFDKAHAKRRYVLSCWVKADGPGASWVDLETYEGLATPLMYISPSSTWSNQTAFLERSVSAGQRMSIMLSHHPNEPYTHAPRRILIDNITLTAEKPSN